MNLFIDKGGSDGERLVLLPTVRSGVFLVLVADLSVSGPQGEKNNGFDVLYHNMKHGQISSKELTDFIRER